MEFALRRTSPQAVLAIKKTVGYLFLFTLLITQAFGQVISPAPGQPAGALSGRIIFTSGGHGWTFANAAGGQKWYTQRVDSNDLVEDYGNADQMNMFVAYCFNAGATVVPVRPVGFQTNEVVLDNTSAAVTFAGSWALSSATRDYFGQVGAVPYRFASLSPTETATATYIPNIPHSGFYPIYTWVSPSTNRTWQLYRILHTGGAAEVRVPHHMVGNGWVYLGTYFLNGGSSSTNGAVVISNIRPTPAVGSVVIADAIRFGNGMGDVVPVSTGGSASTISGYPREEEAARYWAARSLGVGQLASIYDGAGDDGSDNVGTPPRMAAHMNREEEGSMFKRLYLGFHSNAAGTTARGCIGLYNDEALFPGTATPNQFRLAQLVATEVNNDMRVLGVPPLEVAWHSRSASSLTYARSDFAFGEINNDLINDEFDATIIEVGFHDNIDDARLLRDPKVRNVMARASYQAVLRYMNQFDAAPLVFLPDSPRQVRAQTTADGRVRIAWALGNGDGGAPDSFRVYRSTDGYGFGQPVTITGTNNLFVLLNDVVADWDVYFRVAAVNAGGESMPSETVGCRRADGAPTRVLFVNGYDRFERTLDPTQTAGPGIGGPAGGIQTFDRVKPRLINSFDYVVQHGQAISENGVAFDSCANDSITNGQVLLSDYRVVVWAAGRESTADETFSAAEQALVTSFLANGGSLFLSGSEIAWDLDRAAGPTAADRNFLQQQLHASLGGDANDDANTDRFLPSATGIFAGLGAGGFDIGTGDIYNVQYPDILLPLAGAISAANYMGGLPGAAAIQYQHPSTSSRIVFFGFPFEAILSSSTRQQYMFRALAFFEELPLPTITHWDVQLNQGRVTVSWKAVPGRRYRLQFRSQLVLGGWTTLSGDVIATGPMASQTDTSVGANAQRFYRVSLLD